MLSKHLEHINSVDLEEIISTK